MVENEINKKLTKLYTKYDQLNLKLQDLRKYGGSTTDILSVQNKITKVSQHIGYALANLKMMEEL